MKRLATLSFMALLYSTSALAGGGNEGTNTTSVYNNEQTTENYTNTMTVFGNPTYLYLGGELGWLSADTTSGFAGDESFWTIAPVVGLKIGENFGVETSYTAGTSEDNFGSDFAINDYAIDALGYLPLNDSKTVSLVGLVGVGRYQFDSNLAGNDTDTALRYGAGLQHEMGNNWSSRILYRHAEVKTSALEGVDTITLGLTYNFR